MKILLIGGTGQMGFYLCKELIKKNNLIFITTRKKNKKKIKLYRKFFGNKIYFINLNVLDKKDIINKIQKIRPDSIFYLAGQSSVKKSFKNNKETLKSNYVGCRNILHFIKTFHYYSKFINFSSSEIFRSSKKKITINSRKFAVSPYGIAKLKSYQITKEYRKQGIHSYNAILFNSESYLRPKNFILPKICLAAIEAQRLQKYNKNRKFSFGNIQIIRDWGWCEEYAKIILKYINLEPQDFIVATGKSFSIKYLINKAFKFLSLNWENHITQHSNLLRKNEAKYKYACTKQMKKDIGYVPVTNGIKIIYKFIKYYKKNIQN